MVAGERLVAAAIDEQAGGAVAGEPRLHVDVGRGGQGAGGAGLVEGAAEQVQVAPAVRVVPAAMVTVPPRMWTVSRVSEPLIVPPLKATVLPATVKPPGGGV